MPEDARPIGARYEHVRREIERAAQLAGRPPGGVRLVAVSKTVDAAAIRAAYAAGARCFGENYVQEALTKVDEVPRDAEWHMIGHLQSNKATRAVEIFSLIHSLDRPSLAKALEKAARSRGTAVDVLIQVNLGGEATKSGATPDDALHLARRAVEWPRLRLRGLMAIPPFLEDPEAVRPYFRALRDLRDQIAALALPGVEMTELSMGMSHDYAVAIQEGATLVRVGTAIFGERDPVPDGDSPG
jgi:pyridoxal phosphate enzyme (YggS family)